MCYVCLYSQDLLSEVAPNDSHLPEFGNKTSLWKRKTNNNLFAKSLFDQIKNTPHTPLQPADAKQATEINQPSLIGPLATSPTASNDNPYFDLFLDPEPGITDPIQSKSRSFPGREDKYGGGSFYDDGSTHSTNDAFNLSSNPNSSKTIYLDFNGADLTNTVWSVSSLPAFSLDNDFTNFSTAERLAIIEIWKRVSADYAPWDVNITTKEPNASALSRSSSRNTTSHMMAY